MSKLVEELGKHGTVDDMRYAIESSIKIPSMYSYMKDWPTGCFPLKEDLQKFLEDPYIQMVRVVTSKLTGDLWELAMPKKEERFREFCMKAPGRLAEQLDRMFRPEDRKHVRVMRMEMYPEAEGFNFTVFFTTVVYFHGQHANWSKPEPPVEETNAFSLGALPPLVSL